MVIRGSCLRNVCAVGLAFSKCSSCSLFANLALIAFRMMSASCPILIRAFSLMAPSA